MPNLTEFENPMSGKTVDVSKPKEVWSTVGGFTLFALAAGIGFALAQVIREWIPWKGKVPAPPTSGIRWGG